MQRIHFNIEVGEQAVDYVQVAQKEKLTELQLRIKQLLGQVDQITKEQAYQRVSVLFAVRFVTFAKLLIFGIICFSTGRSVSALPARVQISVYSGGRSLKSLF